MFSVDVNTDNLCMNKLDPVSFMLQKTFKQRSLYKNPGSLSYRDFFSNFQIK